MPAVCAQSSNIDKSAPFVVYREHINAETGEFFSVCRLTIVHMAFIKDVLSSDLNETQQVILLLTSLVRVDGGPLSEDRILSMELGWINRLIGMITEQASS